MQASQRASVAAARAARRSFTSAAAPCAEPRGAPQEHLELTVELPRSEVRAARQAVGAPRGASTPPHARAPPHKVTAAVHVVEARDDTPHVRFLRLRVVRARTPQPRSGPRALSPSLRFLRPPPAQDDSRFRFAPGQWLDLWPPGHDAPGGYSIASTPAQLARDRTIDLAVRLPLISCAASASSRCMLSSCVLRPLADAHLPAGEAQ